MNLRVLHVTQSAGGGVSRHVADLVGAAHGVEHHVALPPPWRGEISSGATYDHASVEAMEHAGGTVHHVRMSRNPLHPANPAAVVLLRRLIARLRPDVVHGHSTFGGAVARLSAARTGIPVVHTTHCPRPGLPTTLTERTLGRLTTRLVAVSEGEADELRSRRFIAPERLVVIPNGIDLELPPKGTGPGLRTRLEVPPGTPLIGSVGRLADQKAPAQLVAAFVAISRRRPDAHFLLVGSGPLQQKVERAAERSGAGERWHLIPALPGVAAALGELDVFVSTSRWEAGPYTPLEAMRAGTPVVLSDVVGNRDAVEAGVSGVLTPFADAEAMAVAVVQLLEDEVARKAMVEAAHRRLRERFDVAQMGAAYTALYEDLSRRSTRRLPQDAAGSSTQSPDSRAAQKIS